MSQDDDYPQLLRSSPLQPPQLKDQVRVDLRLVSYSLAWYPAINSDFAANFHCQNLAFPTAGT